MTINEIIINLQNKPAFFTLYFIFSLILYITINLLFWRHFAFKNKQKKDVVVYDRTLNATYQNLEYKQYSKYVYYRVIVETTEVGVTKKYLSDWVSSGPPKDIPSNFTVYLSSKKPEEYYVDIKELQKIYFKKVIVVAVFIPAFFLITIFLCLIFINKK